MSNKDKLTRLVKDCKNMEGQGETLTEMQVNYLIENNVFVAPCKIGDPIWEVYKSYKFSPCKRGLDKQYASCEYDCPDCYTPPTWKIREIKASDYIVSTLIGCDLRGDKCLYCLTPEEAQKLLKEQIEAQ